MIAVGAAVREVSKEFDLYWNSPSAYPAAGLRRRARTGRRRGSRGHASPQRAPTRNPLAYIEAVRVDARWSATCSSAGSRSSGPTPGWCTTIRRRRSTPPAGPTSCSSRSSCGRSAGRRGRSTSSRPTSCRAHEGTAALVALARQGRARCASSPTRWRRPTRSPCTRAMRSAAKTCFVPASSSTSSSRRQGSESHERDARLGSSSSSGLHAKTFAVDREPHLRRLVQLRPALGAAEHRDGPRDREPDARAAAGPGFRHRRAEGRVRGAAGAGRPRPGMDRADRHRARSATTPSRTRAGRCARASSCCRSSRSSGCSRATRTSPGSPRSGVWRVGRVDTHAVAALQRFAVRRP